MDFADPAAARMEIIAVVVTLIGVLVVASLLYVVGVACWGSVGDWRRWNKRKKA